MLKALQEATQSDKNPDGLLKHVRLVSKYPAGRSRRPISSCTPKGMDVYRDKYLIQNASVHEHCRMEPGDIGAGPVGRGEQPQNLCPVSG